MRRSKYTEEQIIGFLRQVEAGMALKELCRKHGFTDGSASSIAELASPRRIKRRNQVVQGVATENGFQSTLSHR